MRNYQKAELLERCKAEIHYQIQEVNTLFSLQKEELLITSPLPAKWSAKQCVEHLNTTFELYEPRIRKALTIAQNDDRESLKHGFIGYKLMTTILPIEEKKLRSMKTFRKLDPKVSGRTGHQVVIEFAERMNTLSEFIDQSLDKNIQKIKVTSAAGILLRLRLGDLIPFLLNHNIRHLIQAKKAVELCKKHND